MPTRTLLDRAVGATLAGSDRVLIIGAGAERRHDDAVGPAVIERLRWAGFSLSMLPTGHGVPGTLRQHWRRADLAIVVAAARNDPAHPGRIHTLVTDLPDQRPGEDVVRELTGMPRRVVVYAVEGADFTPGPGLSPVVSAAADRLTQLIARQLATEATPGIRAF